MFLIMMSLRFLDFIPLQCIQGEIFLQHTMETTIVFFETKWHFITWYNDEMQVYGVASTRLLEGTHGMAQIGF